MWKMNIILMAEGGNITINGIDDIVLSKILRENKIKIKYNREYEAFVLNKKFSKEEIKKLMEKYELV